MLGLEEFLKVAIVEQIYQGYEMETKKVALDLNIGHKSGNLNVAKVKRESNLKKWLDSDSQDRFIFVDKRSFLFIDKVDNVLYAYMSDDNRKQLVRKFKKLKELTYLTALVILKNPSIEQEHDKHGQLFDATEFEIEKNDSETYEEAMEKSKSIIENYGDFINSVSIITRDSSIGDTPRIAMYELSDNCEILYKEDWSKYIPVNFATNRINEGIIDKKNAHIEKRRPKHTKLRKEKRKIE